MRCISTWCDIESIRCWSHYVDTAIQTCFKAVHNWVVFIGFNGYRELTEAYFMSHRCLIELKSGKDGGPMENQKVLCYSHMMSSHIILQEQTIPTRKHGKHIKVQMICNKICVCHTNQNTPVLLGVFANSNRPHPMPLQNHLHLVQNHVNRLDS